VNPRQDYINRVRTLGNLCSIAAGLLSALFLWVRWKYGVTSGILLFLSTVQLVGSAVSILEVRRLERK
jgi:hypothetical protein